MGRASRLRGILSLIDTKSAEQLQWDERIKRDVKARWCLGVFCPVRWRSWVRCFNANRNTETQLGAREGRDLTR